jgi:hypothetical protein
MIQADKLWSLFPAEQGLVEARRSLLAFGLPYELVLIPSRADRAHFPGMERPAFVSDKGGRIRQEEALVREDGIVLTPNRFSFYEQQCLIWQAEGFAREAPVALLEAGFRLAEQTQAALLINSIGASASICQAHGHLVRAQSKVLAAFPMKALGAARGLRLLATDPLAGHPSLTIQIRGGAPSDRARLVRALLDLRTAASYHVLAQAGAAWVIPRRREIVAEVSPYALGAAEFFGRFVFPERKIFERLDRKAIELALSEASVPASTHELQALEDLLPELFARAL